MKCGNCGKADCEHPLCNECMAKHCINYLRENWQAIIARMNSEWTFATYSVEEFTEYLFDQDIWFDIYPYELYDNEWFFSGAYHDSTILNHLENMLWIAITCDHPHLQKVIVDVAVDGL